MIQENKESRLLSQPPNPQPSFAALYLPWWSVYANAPRVDIVAWPRVDSPDAARVTGFARVAVIVPAAVAERCAVEAATFAAERAAGRAIRVITTRRRRLPFLRSEVVVCLT